MWYYVILYIKLSIIPHIFFFKIYIFFLLYFSFWGTCAEHTRLLYGYIHGNVVCCLHPPSSVTFIWHFSPCYPSPTSLPPTVPPLFPSTDPSVWCSPLCVHVFWLFNTHLWVRTCCVWSSIPLLVYWEWWFPASFMSLQRTWTHPFLWLHSIAWCICATFSLSSLSLKGICVGSKSLLLWIVLQYTYTGM